MTTVKDIGLLRTAEDLANAVEKIGFLPFFKNGIPGFSIDEHTPRELWFTSVEGPWEWKGPAIRSGICSYGKVFKGKAGYISMKFLPDFLNYRRDGYDYDSRYDDGLMPASDFAVIKVLDTGGAMLSTELKEKSGYGRDGRKGFDRIITRLQMQGYVTVADFEYSADKYGNTYGWGTAKYSTFEELYGYDFVRSAYKRKPGESFGILIDQLKIILPDVSEKALARFLV